MAGYRDVNDILSRIDTALEVAVVDGDIVTATRESQFAQPIADATGLDTVVVRAPDGASGEEAALFAARQAAEAFLPRAAMKDMFGGEA